MNENEKEIVEVQDQEQEAEDIVEKFTNIIEETYERLNNKIEVLGKLVNDVKTRFSREQIIETKQEDMWGDLE